VIDDPGELAQEDGFDTVIVQQVQGSVPLTIDRIPQEAWIHR